MKLSPSFTPTSVIRKMFESKDKSKDGKESHPVKDFVEDGHGLIEGIVGMIICHYQLIL